MAQTGLIIKRNASLAIPDAYSQLALKENPTAWGAAIVTPEGLLTNSADSPMDLEVLSDTLKDYDNRDIYLYLCNSESAINMDDVSPHWIIEKDGNPLLVGFFDGSFPGFTKSESSHPSEYHFATEFVIPKIQGMYEMCDGDLLKVLAQIEKPLFKKELMVHANPRGFVTLVAANGKALTFGSGEGSAEYKWGWVSKNYDYAVVKAEPPKEEVQQKKSLFPSKSTTREKHVPAAPGTPVAAAVAAGGTAVVQNFTVRKEAPRSTDSRSDRKTFYQRRIGYCPKGWEKNIQIEVWVDKVTNQTVFLSEIKKLGIDAVGVPKLNNPSRAEGKDTEPNAIGGSDKPTGPAVTDAVLPIMSPKTREYAIDFLKKEDVKHLIAENGSPISDPKDTKGHEIKIAGFGEQLGMKEGLNDFARLPFSQYMKIVTEKPELMANLCWAFKNMAFTFRLKAGDKMTAEEKHELAHEELKPAKKSLFPQKKVA